MEVNTTNNDQNNDPDFPNEKLDGQKLLLLNNAVIGVTLNGAKIPNLNQLKSCRKKVKTLEM